MTDCRSAEDRLTIARREVRGPQLVHRARRGLTNGGRLPRPWATATICTIPELSWFW
jgi:hypothetical protein